MVAALVDTSIVIDVLRAYTPALEWFAGQNDLAVCRMVWFEVVEGASNNRDLRAAMQFLYRFELVEVTVPDMIWTSETHIKFSLSHNIDTFDCISASVNHRLQLPLYTRNLKHFEPLIPDLTNSPY